MAKIIICDDDVELYKTLEDFLGSLGHATIHAINPKKLLELLQTVKPDLIILDMQMPGGGAPQSVLNLESDPLLGNIPVLFCSGMPLRHLKNWFPERPNRRYIAKPVDTLLMKELVAELLKK